VNEQLLKLGTIVEIVGMEGEDGFVVKVSELGVVTE
jgi:hypothetical protein